MCVCAEVNRLEVYLSELNPGTGEYDKALEELNTLVHIQATGPEHLPWYEKLLKNSALVTGVIGLVGMGMMLNFERAEIITSKAFNHIRFK